MLDDRGDTVGRGRRRLAVMAVDDEGRAALADVGRREAGGVGDRDDALVVRAAGCAGTGRGPGDIRTAALDLLDQREDAFGRLHQGALPDQGNEEIDLPISLVERPAVLQQAVEKPG